MTSFGHGEAGAPGTSRKGSRSIPCRKVDAWDAVEAAALRWRLGNSAVYSSHCVCGGDVESLDGSHAGHELYFLV